MPELSLSPRESKLWLSLRGMIGLCEDICRRFHHAFKNYSNADSPHSPKYLCTMFPIAGLFKYFCGLANGISNQAGFQLF